MPKISYLLWESNLSTELFEKYANFMEDMVRYVREERNQTHSNTVAVNNIILNETTIKEEYKRQFQELTTVNEPVAKPNLVSNTPFMFESSAPRDPILKYKKKESKGKPIDIIDEIMNSNTSVMSNSYMSANDTNTNRKSSNSLNSNNNTYFIEANSNNYTSTNNNVLETDPFNYLFSNSINNSRVQQNSNTQADPFSSLNPMNNNNNFSNLENDEDEFGEMVSYKQQF